MNVKYPPPPQILCLTLHSISRVPLVVLSFTACDTPWYYVTWRSLFFFSNDCLIAEFWGSRIHQHNFLFIRLHDTMKLLVGLLLFGLNFYTDLEFSFDIFFPNVQAIYFKGNDYCAAICYPRFLSTYFTLVIRSSFTRTSQRMRNFAISILTECFSWYSIQMHAPAWYALLSRTLLRYAV